MGTYDHLTGVELDRAAAAAAYLVEHSELLKLEKIVMAKLSSLHSDLTVEQEDRRKLARS